MTTVIDLKLKEVHPSPFNHRKIFRDMEQLAESIKARGVLQPITVRPNNKGWEIIFGERRWRASKLAGVETIPAIEIHMTDVEVLEAQLIENVQRSDVHALEEADGYQELIKKHKYTVEQLVAKTGKSKAYIYARLKLCDLAPAPRKAFLEDKIVASIALMIARIPDPKLQAQATEEVLGNGGWNTYKGVRPAEIYDEDDDDGDESGGQRQQPLSVREAQVHLQRKYTLRLDQAPFSTTDATLLPKAGACTTCHYRTGNQPELFADVKSADVCTRPSCFEDKRNADWDRKTAEAKQAGQRVLSEKESNKVFESYAGGGIRYDSSYIDPSAKLPYDLDSTGKKTWQSLLGKEAPATVLARDPNGNARTLWDKQSAIAKAKKSGKLKEAKAESRYARAGGSKYQDEQRKRQKEAKRRHRIARAVFAKIADKAKDAAGDPFWRWLAIGVVRMLDSEDQRNLCKRRELDAKVGSGDAEKTLIKLINETKGVDSILALVAEFVASHRAVGGMWAGKHFGPNFMGACEVLGIDLKKVSAELAKEDAAQKSKKKPAKAKAGK